MHDELEAPTGSILNLVARGWSGGKPATFAIRPTIRIGSAVLIPVAIDNGNDALKGAALRRDPSLPEGEGVRSLLTTIRVPTAFALTQEIQGRQEVTCACDGVQFWTGEAAFTHSGDALRLGPTIQRIDDERQRWFIGAGIVELLRSSGFAPGEYAIALTLAVPNTEIVMTLRVGAKHHQGWHSTPPGPECGHRDRAHPRAKRQGRERHRRLARDEAAPRREAPSTSAEATSTSPRSCSARRR